MAQRIHLNTLLDIMIKMLCVRLPQMTGYAKKFDENATLSFRANNKQFLKIYNKIWEKVEKLLKIDFGSKPVYGDDDKYIKSKINIYSGSVVTNFHNKILTKEKAPCNVKYFQKNVNMYKNDSNGDPNDETESDIDNDE